MIFLLDMLKRIEAVLTIREGVFTRTRNFIPDNEYSLAHLDFDHFDGIILLCIDKNKPHDRFYDLLERLGKEAFIPITASGRISTEADADLLFQLGADRIIMNSALWDSENEEMIRSISSKYGNQSIVASIDVMRDTSHKLLAFDWHSYKCRSSLLPKIITSHLELFGEVQIQSFDHDGCSSGAPIEEARYLSSFLDNRIPFIIGSGMYSWPHYSDVLGLSFARAVSVSNVHHISSHAVKTLKSYCMMQGVDLRYL